MLVKFRRLAIASALVVPTVVGLSVVSASAASSAHFKAVTVHGESVASQPNTNLVGSGTTVMFSPKKLIGLTSVSSADCSDTDYSFSMTNETARTQTLTEGGASTHIKIPAATVVPICVFGDGTLKLGLKSSPAAKLRLVTTS
jgi:hypothetical protein